jgi:mRNA-degrading endonuclease toxin of MazEF toxin-antitoxin module
MERFMNIGDIVHLQWTPSSGKEMAQNHYGVILSSSIFNAQVPRTVVAPITSKEHPEYGRLRVPLEAKKSTIKGFICLDHVRAIDPDSRELRMQGDQISYKCQQECKFVLRKILEL